MKIVIDVSFIENIIVGSKIGYFIYKHWLENNQSIIIFNEEPC